MPTVSVIIPVYNAHDYLARCLDSVCNQTLSDIEIICINDCSTDDSIDILNRYSQKYSFLKVIDCKENGGESKARNIGLDNATGEYIAFVDNDDTVDLDFYEKLYNKAKETDADIVKAEVIVIDYNKEKIFSHLNEKIIKNNKWWFEYEWWTAIYRLSMIRKDNLKLPEGFLLGGDQWFLHKAIEYCNNLQLVKGVFYHWIRRDESGDSKILSKDKIVSALTLYKKIFNNINLLYSMSKIDEKSYNFLTKCNLYVSFTYFWRNVSDETRVLCIRHMLYVLKNSLNIKYVNNLLNNECFLIEDSCKNNDVTNILLIMKQCVSYDEFIHKNILFKLRKRVVCNV